MNFRKNIILTGAGFSKNFGGFLTSEMWAKMFNNPKLNNVPKIKSLFKEQSQKFNFEYIYFTIMNNPKYKDHRKVFEQVLFEAYFQMKQSIEKNKTKAVNKDRLKEFFKLFQTDDNQYGMCFTLNQDLFMEQYFDWQPLISRKQQYTKKDGYIDVSYGPNYKQAIKLEIDEEPNHFITNIESSVKNFDQNLLYVKLHGSYGWVSGDERNRMIIGINKENDINNEPLLRWYFNLFEDTINNAEKLLIIGYSFKDDHINKLLAIAVKKGLKIFVVLPTNLTYFYKSLTLFDYEPTKTVHSTNNDGKDIWNSIEGYFPYKLSEIFPKNQTHTDTSKTLFEIFS